VKMDRREFARLGALAVAAGVQVGGVGSALAAASLSPSSSASPAYGVQLYSAREILGKDTAGVLRAIRKIGYTEVELFWEVYGHSAKELRAMVSDAGLTAPSGLFHFEGLESRIEFAAEIGMKYMVCPDIPKMYTGSLDGMKRAGAEFNRLGERVAAGGLRLAYHNANPEFRPWEGTNLFTALMDHTDPKLVGLEIDCYWAVQGGQDMNAMLEKYRDRVHLLHLKDRTANATVSYVQETPPGHFTDVGKGTIDWPSILRKARAQGIQYFFVDQDGSSLPELESLKVSFDYLKTLRV
jgi:sugar phosphate isomerase/epimerase